MFVKEKDYFGYVHTHTQNRYDWLSITHYSLIISYAQNRWLRHSYLTPFRLRIKIWSRQIFCYFIQHKYFIITLKSLSDLTAWVTNRRFTRCLSWLPKSREKVEFSPQSTQYIYTHKQFLSSLNIPVTLTSTRPERVPMLLVASHMYVPLKSFVTGPLKSRVLFLISTFWGSEPFNLSVKRNTGVKLRLFSNARKLSTYKSTKKVDPFLQDPT